MTKTIKKSGFTLIELLIVIGLLAALAAVLLPSLMGDRDAALNSIDKYNQAGTLRTLRQYEAMTGQLPNGFHTGLTAVGAGAPSLMRGVSATFSANVAASTDGGILQLSAGEATALRNLGIEQLAYGSGEPNEHSLAEALGYENVAQDLYVIVLDEDWVDKSSKNMSFNGKGPHYLEHEGYSKVIAFFITPTLQWTVEGKGWVEGFKVAMDIPATSPLPESEEFPYYIAYVGIQGGVTVVASNSGTQITVPHVPGPQASVSDMQDAIKAQYDTTAFPGVTWSWDDSVPGTYKGTASGTGAANNAIVTYTITEDTIVAKLLGTSNPDCVVTNP